MGLLGRLTYDSTLVADFDDRVLAHLQVVITAKLRRGESFAFSWNDSRDIGSGRTTIWLSESVPLSFRFFGSRPPQINRAWVEHLTQTANSAGGLRIVPEPTQPAGQDER